MKRLTWDEVQTVDKVLGNTGVVQDTLHFWKQNRLKGISASMCCDGNISLVVLKALDEVAKELNNVRSI